MKKGLLLFALLAGTSVTNIYAQQDKALTHWIFDRTTFNPAATALSPNDVCGTFIYRNQWDKINGAPNSGSFNIEADVNQYVPGLFGGISFFQDMIGFNRQNFATLNVGYSLKNLIPLDLRIGFGVGMMNHSITPAWLPPQTIIDPTLPAAYSSTKFDANVGIYLRHELNSGDEFNIGLSSTHLPAIEHEGISSISSTLVTGFKTARHFYMMGGYKFADIRGTDAIDANFMIASDIVKTTVNVNVRYLWEDKAYGGLTFRSDDQVGLMLGVKPGGFIQGFPRQLLIGYSYDFTINALSTISNGSHEILVRYCHPLPGIPLTITKHPRWL